MARQIKIYFKGTFNNMTGYVMNGTGFLRSKSNLTGKLVKSKPEFKKTMELAHKLGEASKLASSLYKSVPAKLKSIKLFRLITGQVILGFRKGNTEKEIRREIIREIPSLVKDIKNGIR